MVAVLEGTSGSSYVSGGLTEAQKREQALKSGPKLPDALKPKEQTQDAMKTELLVQVMEARLSRLQNYKLTGDSKLWDRDYQERAKKVDTFLQYIKTTGMTHDGIVSASNSLDYREKSIIRDQILPSWNGKFEDFQKMAIKLMRADNGTDQVEAVAVHNLGDLFTQGITKLQSDTKALADIKRRAMRDFGDMVKQGAFDNADEDAQNASRVGLEAMYQMRYIAKEYFDEKGGIPVPQNLRHVWDNYRDSMDIKDEWFTISDTGKTQLASFILYDLAPMIISGGVAGAVGKGLIGIATKMPAIVKYANTGTRAARALSIAGRVGVAGIEAVVFDGTFEGMRNQRWFTEKPTWKQDILKNMVGFGFSRYFAGATKFAGIKLDPASSQLIKQGFVVPAMMTTTGVAQKLMANDPDAYHGAWEEFLLGAIMMGAFHSTGKVLEARGGKAKTGISRIEPTGDGTQIKITSTDGQTITTKMPPAVKQAIEGVHPEIIRSDRIQGLRNEIAAATAKERRINITPESLATKKAQLAQLEGTVGTQKNPNSGGKALEQATPKSRTPKKPLETYDPINSQYNKRARDLFRKRYDSTLSSIDSQISTLAAKSTKNQEITKIKIGGTEYTVTYSPWDKTPGRAFEILVPEGKTLKSVQKFHYEAEVKSWLGKEARTQFGIDQSSNITTRTTKPKQDSTMSSIERAHQTKKTELFNKQRDAILSTVDSQISTLAAKSTKNQEITKIKIGGTEYTVTYSPWDKTPGRAFEILVPEGKTLKSVQKFHYEAEVKSWLNKKVNQHFGEKQQKYSPRQEIKPIDGTKSKNATGANEGTTSPRNPSTSEGFRQETPATTDHLKYKITRDMRNDIHDAMIKGEDSQLAQRIRNEYPDPRFRHDPETQRIITKVKSLNSIDEVKGALEANVTGPRRANTEVIDTIEREALRVRAEQLLKPVAPELIPLSQNPRALGEALKDPNKWSKWLLLIPLLLMLGYCATKDKNPSAPIVPPTPDDAKTPDAAAAYCEKCYGGSVSKIDWTRKINGRTADEKYRLGVSHRWMNGPDWKKLIKEYNENIRAVPDGDFKTAMNKVLTGNYGVTDVQNLQHCIAMLDGTGVSADSKESQDGMLGTITTAAIRQYINECKGSALTNS